MTTTEQTLHFLLYGLDPAGAHTYHERLIGPDQPWVMEECKHILTHYSGRWPDHVELRDNHGIVATWHRVPETGAFLINDTHPKETE